MKESKCEGCGSMIHPLEVFPGNICLACHQVKIGDSMPTAQELVRMWGGK